MKIYGPEEREESGTVLKEGSSLKVTVSCPSFIFFSTKRLPRRRGIYVFLCEFVIFWKLTLLRYTFVAPICRLGCSFQPNTAAFQKL